MPCTVTEKPRERHARFMAFHAKMEAALALLVKRVPGSAIVPAYRDTYGGWELLTPATRLSPKCEPAVAWVPADQYVTVWIQERKPVHYDTRDGLDVTVSVHHHAGGSAMNRHMASADKDFAANVFDLTWRIANEELELAERDARVGKGLLCRLNGAMSEEEWKSFYRSSLE
jgi:hypothetical protein